jgi:predicted ester cyclase
VSENPTAVVNRWITDFYSTGVFEAAGDFIDANCVVHHPDGDIAATPDWFASVARYWRLAVPDLICTVEDQFELDSKVVTRFRIAGTHTGDNLFGVPAQGGPLDAGGMSLARVEGGRIVELWESFDKLRLMRQLGADLYYAP